MDLKEGTGEAATPPGFPPAVTNWAGFCRPIDSSPIRNTSSGIALHRHEPPAPAEPTIDANGVEILLHESSGLDQRPDLLQDDSVGSGADVEGKDEQ